MMSRANAIAFLIGAVAVGIGLALPDPYWWPFCTGGGATCGLAVAGVFD